MVKSVRNDTNRLINAEVANQIKTANASIRPDLRHQRIVLETYGLEQPAACAAGNHPVYERKSSRCATLKELGEYASPPLSKSAVYHRVRRIQQMAREVKG